MRVAVIGFGRMGRLHARRYLDIPGVTLAAAADPDPAARGAARELGCRAYASAEDLVAAERLDAVSICAPTPLHRPLAELCLGAGLHVLLEKPIAPTVDDAEAIVRAAERARRVLMVGHVERFNPSVRALGRLVREGRLGALLQLHFQRLGPRPDPPPAEGVVVDLGVHDLDLAAHIAGAPVTDIAAIGAPPPRSRDAASILARCGDVAVTIQLSWTTPAKIRRVSACGTDGCAELNLVSQDLRLFRRDPADAGEPTSFPEFVSRFGGDAGRPLPFPDQGREPLRIELEEFLGAVRFGWRVPSDGRAATEALRWALAASSLASPLEAAPWPA